MGSMGKTKLPIIGARICELPSCKRIHYGKGYCAPHYRSFIKYGDPLMMSEVKKEAELKQKEREIEANKTRENLTREGTCEAEGCTSPITSRRLCLRHYAQKRKGKVVALRVDIPGDTGLEG